jgi:hypothetical protein
MLLQGTTKHEKGFLAKARDLPFGRIPEFIFVLKAKKS